MKFVVILPLVLTLTSARVLLENDNQGSGVYQDAGPDTDSPALEAARNIISYMQSSIASGDQQALASLFEDVFVFKRCNGKQYNKQQAVEILVKTTADVAASFEVETAVFAERALYFTVKMKGDLPSLFIAIPSGKNPTGWSISSGLKQGC